jgi:hypothetical protein
MSRGQSESHGTFGREKRELFFALMLFMVWLAAKPGYK